MSIQSIPKNIRHFLNAESLPTKKMYHASIAEATQYDALWGRISLLCSEESVILLAQYIFSAIYGKPCTKPNELVPKKGLRSSQEKDALDWANDLLRKDVTHLRLYAGFEKLSNPMATYETRYPNWSKEESYVTVAIVHYLEYPALHGLQKIIKKLHEKGHTSHLGWNKLHWAIFFEDYDGIKKHRKFLNTPSDKITDNFPELKLKWTKYPIGLAACRKPWAIEKTRLIDKLISLGADLNVNPPLVTAAFSYKNDKVCEFLIKKGAPNSLGIEDCRSALERALERPPVIPCKGWTCTHSSHTDNTRRLTPKKPNHGLKALILMITLISAYYLYKKFKGPNSYNSRTPQI